MTSSHRYFGFDSEVRDQDNVDLPTRIARCLQSEIERLGLPLDVMPDGIERELSRRVAKSAFDEMEAQGVTLHGTRLVDLGSGMGAAAIEAAIRGAWPIAVEPGRGLREVAALRLSEIGRGIVLAGNAESLPLADKSIDVVVSLQVLEHVANPRAAIQEVFRILRPGGFFFFSCENYLSFREPHYRVAWLPLLPKRIGAVYLRLRGRPPEFLYDSITYVTRPMIIRTLRECGFILHRRERLDALVRDPTTIKSRWKSRFIAVARRVVSPESLSAAAFAAQEARHMFDGVVYELVRKPA